MKGIGMVELEYFVNLFRGCGMIGVHVRINALRKIGKFPTIGSRVTGQGRRTGECIDGIPHRIEKGTVISAAPPETMLQKNFPIPLSLVKMKRFIAKLQPFR